MNLFAVIYCYPPLLVPATLCYLKLLVGLREAGCGITVLTRDPASFDGRLNRLSDHSLSRLLPEGVRNFRIRSWEASAVLKGLKSFSHAARLLYRLFEPKGNEWRLPALHALKKSDLSEYDLILSCSQPHVNHLIGYSLKQATGKPWVAYFSDPWTDNPYSQYSPGRIYEYHRELEERVVRNADAVLFTSEEMAELVMKKYPGKYREKCDVVPHSFIPEWYGMREGRLPGRRSGRITVLHTGHFYGPRTPMPVLDALAGLNREIDLAELVDVYFFGNMERKYHEFIRERGLDSFCKAGEMIPYLDSLSSMQRSDYLLLVDAPLKETSESVFLPSKLIDYIGSFRPVIGITPRHGASARVLGESGNLACGIESPEEIYDALKKLVLGRLEIRPDRGGIMKYHYANTTKKLMVTLRGLV